MKKKYIKLLSWILLLFSFSSVSAQNRNMASADSAKSTKMPATIVDYGLRTEKEWRNTGAIFTLKGEDLTHMMSGNLLNTLQGRIPGLTVVTGSGEPGYDNPTLYVRGQSSWNIAGNQLLIYLDGFQADLGALSSLSAYEIESVTLLKDAAATSIYGLQGGAGVLSIRTKKGTLSKTQITVNGRYGILSPVQLPKTLNAYDYTTLYNQALSNDGLPAKYVNPELYKAENDPFHPNVNWYDQVLKKVSTIQDYNLSFRGGSEMAKFFVLMNYTNSEGLYKNADAIDKDFGTNAKYNKINLRVNLDLQLSKSLSVQTNITGITEDRNTPGGFPAGTLFNNLLAIPSAAFPVKNPNGTWGNSSVYNFNPVELLQQNGIYSSHTRTLQTNFGFKEKLDGITPGLSLNGSLSFSNQYVGVYQKLFSVPSYEILKDANDQPVKDVNGNIVYKTIGNISQSINDGGNQHWNRNTVKVGFDYNRTFGKGTITAMLLAQRQGYSHDGLVYQIRTQGLSGEVTYDYDQKYILSLSGAYNGSADFAPGHRYGFFPAVGLGWIASKEDFLKEVNGIDYLKIRATYGASGNINEAFRFLNEQWAIGGAGWIVGTNNAGRGGMTEGAFANVNASWEKKTTMNIGMDLKLWKKISATVDVFSDKRTGILEIPSANVPAYTGFYLQNANTGEVSNKGFETAINFNDKISSFEYNLGFSAAYARNKITKRSENAQPYSYLYTQGYRLDQMKGLVFKGFYQQSDFDGAGNLKAGVPSSSYANVKPGDLKFADQDGNGIINDYDKVPLDYSKLPEITLGFNLGFKYCGFDFDAYGEGVLHRTVSLLDNAYTYTHPFVNNNNITPFSANSWTPATATTATTPRLSTLSNANNNQPSDFWFRNGNFFKLRSVELGYTLPRKSFLKKLDAVRVFVNGTNLIIWDKIDNLEAEGLSMGYPLMKVVSFGVNVKL